MFIFFLLVLVVTVLLLPSAPQQSESTLDDVGAPTASAGRPIPHVFGTVKLKSPNIIWYGNMRKEKVYAG
jgi:hypothetical protein